MSSVNSLFIDAVKLAANGTPVALPNIKFDPTGLQAYYQVWIIPARKEALGISKSDVQNGFCQVSCFVQEDKGEIRAVNMAETIIRAFPRNTRLKSNDLTVEINKPAYYTNGLTSNKSWYMVPVTIPYVVIT